MYVEAKPFTLTEARRRARRGAKLLDKKKPGWWKRATIQTRRLNLASGCDCVLGQVFAKAASSHPLGESGFEVGAAQLFPDSYYDEYLKEYLATFDTKACDYNGFDAPSGDDGEYALLGQAWLEEIRSRRAAAKVAA